MTALVDRNCRPCEGGVVPLSADQARELMPALHPDWKLADAGDAISRVFAFGTFGKTIAFANAVAWIATSEGHHPEMTVNYGSCRVRYMTTAIDGLSDNDFICAAKIDRLATE
ncbi:MAG: 4a-hydroxytetrahydrobiopterin dehydratase [Woeseia sp.]